MIFQRLLVLSATVLAVVLAAPQEAGAQPLRDEPVQQQAPQGQSVAPQQALGQWMQQAVSAYESGDHEQWVEALENLHELRPYNQDFMVQLVSGYAVTGKTSRAFEVMLKMQQQGLAQDWSDNEMIESMRDHRLFGHLEDLMSDAAKPFGEGQIVTRLEGIAMPEALAHDPDSGRWFLATVHDGQVLTSEDLESWEVFFDSEEDEGTWAIFDLALDTERNHLWLATGPTRQYRHFDGEDAGKTALVRLDLETGEVLSRHSPDLGGAPSLLGSMVIADDGTIFASDTINPVLFRLLPEEDAALNPVFSNPRLTSLRGLALSGDQEKLYVADYELGIFVVDLAGGRSYQLATPDELNLGGIDGLYWWNQHLVVIQNNITPQRVVRLALGEDGLGVTGIVPLEAGHEAFDLPTYGTVVANDLVFLGGSHWDHVDRDGMAISEDGLPEVPVFRTPLDSEAAMEIMDQESLRRRLQEQGN